MLYIHSASNRSFRKSLVFVGSCRPRWQFLSCVKKGTKDTPKTSWFLDFQQKGALPPLDSPRDTPNFCDKRGEVSRSDCRDYGRCKNKVLYHVQTARLCAVGELLWYFLRKYSLINMLCPRLPWILQACRSKHRCQTGVPVQMACSGRIHQQPL